MTDQRERKVKFHGRVQFKTIRHVADFDEDEIQEGWYQKQDFARMSDEVGEIARLVAEGKDKHNGEEISIRGLEHLVEEEVADYRAEKMIASIDAVLDEQDEQRDEEITDAEAIAKIYSEIATPLLREAYLVGLRDAEEAQLACQTMEDMKLLPTPAAVSASRTIRKVKPESTAAAAVVVASPPPLPPPPAPSPVVGDKTSVKPKKKKDKPKTKKSPPPPPTTTKTTKVESKPTSLPSKSTKYIPPRPYPLPAATEEGEEMLNFVEEELKSPKKQMSKEERKAAAEARKSRDRTGKASEMSPLVRRLDGSFAFRNKGQESAKAALKKERRDAVKDSLFKFLDSL